MQRKTNDNRSTDAMLAMLAALDGGLAKCQTPVVRQGGKRVGPPPEVKPHHRTMSGGGKRARRRARARKRALAGAVGV